MKKTTQLDRFVELVRRHLIYLKPLPTAKQIATEFKVSKRTAFRDLDHLKFLVSELNKYKSY